MSGITVKQKGDFKKLEKYLKQNRTNKVREILEKYGKRGVELLSAATPVRTGLTASSWSYEIEQSAGKATIHYTNSNVNKYVNVALILQYGHGTGTGGWVRGVDYINPAMDETFKGMADEAWKEIVKIG